ncbi:hypothetical protein ACUXI4_004472 [Pantoea piersonii]
MCHKLFLPKKLDAVRGLLGIMKISAESLILRRAGCWFVH